MKIPEREDLTWFVCDTRVPGKDAWISAAFVIPGLRIPEVHSITKELYTMGLLLKDAKRKEDYDLEEGLYEQILNEEADKIARAILKAAREEFKADRRYRRRLMKLDGDDDAS